MNRGEKAFTLLEILVALGIFAVAVAGLISLFPSILKVTREGEEEARATLIASSILDMLPIHRPDGECTLATGMEGGSLHLITIAATPSQHLIAYGPSCEPIRELDAAQLEHPCTDPSVTDLALLILSSKTSLPGLMEAEVDVSSPASAPLEGRTIFRFVRLLPLSHR